MHGHVYSDVCADMCADMCARTGTDIGHNYIGHNYMRHNHIRHNYIGHNYIGHREMCRHVYGHISIHIAMPCVPMRMDVCASEHEAIPYVTIWAITTWATII